MIRWFVLLMVLGTSASNDQLEQLAHSGRIHDDAPIKASIELVINAPVEKVWRLLTDVNDWPKWQPDISKAELSGPLGSGTTFAWTNGGTDIQSRIALVQQYEQFAWTGKAYQARAIHAWKLERLPGDRTLVKVSESMDGFLLSLFYSSKKLEEGERRWLDCMKKAAEK